MKVFFLLATLAELFAGIGLIVLAKTDFREMEGLMLVAFWLLTMAVMASAQMIIKAIGEAKL